MAIFNGDLKSDNYNEAAGTGWRIGRGGYIDVPNAAFDTLKLADRSVSTQWSANAASLSIVTKYPMELIIITSVRVAGESQGVNLTYQLKRGGTVEDSNVFSGSPYSTNFTSIKSLSVNAATHNFSIVMNQDQSWYSQFRIIILGLYK